MIRGLWVVLVAALGCLVLAGCGVAETADVQSEPEQQLSWGAAIYRYNCARCHEPDRGAPELRQNLLATYDSADALLDYVSTAMPLDRPGSLPDAQYMDVVAYLLSRENLLALPEGEKLNEDNAASVEFSAGAQGTASR